MRRLFQYIVGTATCLVVAITLTAPNAQAFSGAGTGADQDHPFMITTCLQLQEMAGDLDAWYQLANNIDCSATTGWNSGAGFAPVGDSVNSFIGMLEGDGFTISGLTINRPTTDYVGLFGYFGSIGFARENTVQHLKLDDVSINGQNYVGGVAGQNVSVVHDVGITGEINGVAMVGGIAGKSIGYIYNSYSRANISGVPGTGIGGGLVGENGGFIDGSYSTGLVPDGSGKGGFVGNDLDSGGVFSSFWDTQASGNISSMRGTGKTTAEMKNVATFTDGANFNSPWDFVDNPYADVGTEDVWDINPLINQGYPYLVDHTPVDSDGDGFLDTYENNGPNNGDANDDGVLDSLQPNVAGVLGSDNKWTIVDLNDGACALLNVHIVTEDGLNTQDQGYNYPGGLVDFTGTCPGPTGVTLYFYDQPIGGGSLVRKYNPISKEYGDISTQSNDTTIDGHTVGVSSYTISDGSPQDTDGNPLNGQFSDPIGLAIVENSSPAASTQDSRLAETGQSSFAYIGASIVLIVGGLIIVKRLW